LYFSLYGLVGASRKSPCLVIIIIIIIWWQRLYQCPCRLTCFNLCLPDFTCLPCLYGN